MFLLKYLLTVFWSWKIIFSASLGWIFPNKTIDPFGEILTAIPFEQRMRALGIGRRVHSMLSDSNHCFAKKGKSMSYVNLAQKVKFEREGVWALRFMRINYQIESNTYSIELDLFIIKMKLFKNRMDFIKLIIITLDIEIHDL